MFMMKGIAAAIAALSIESALAKQIETDDY